MAKTSTIEYTTHRYMKDIYPALSEYDTKKRIYGWEIDDNLGYAQNTGLVTMLYSDGAELGNAESTSGAVNGVGKWYYDSALDKIWYYFGSSNTNPNDKIMEAGEDWATLVTRMIRRSSRMVESMLDSRMAREIVKDREGSYPEFIQRATGLKAIIMLMQSSDPDNPIMESFKDEFEEIIESYRSGLIQLPNSVTPDSSRGVIREVSVDSSSDLRLVELKGIYQLSGYDLIKIVINTGGIIGTSTYSVYVKDSDKLKSHLVVSQEKITGDYDEVAHGIFMRFSGDDDSAITTANDEYEISVFGNDCEVSTSHVGGFSLTRR
tara:strand:- start:35433 stop:36395 length:963 start_codon:yes stop_codon:yes gene_type:complete